MLDSVRVRLTIWYTALLAVFLVMLSLVSYFIFWRSTVERSASDLSELSDAFLVTLDSELEDQPGPDLLKNSAREAIIEHRFRDHVYAVLGPKGELLVSSGDLPAANPPDDASPAKVLASDAFRKFAEDSLRADRLFRDVKGDKAGYRGLSRRFSLQGHAGTLIILQSLHPQKEMLEEIRATFAWVIPIALLLSSAGGYFLARKSLAPVVAMSSQAGRIGEANLHDRLAVQNEKDELGHLARSFNGLLDRLDQSFERQRRFMADASHELRTPVAILRGEAEVALSKRAREAEDYRESLTILHQEAQRLTQIVEDLFTLTRADAGQYPIAARDFYLDELVADCVRSARSLALAKRIKLTCEDMQESPIHADEPLLRRMILNLLDNAIKYTPEGGSVNISCRWSGNEYALRISDTGVGIPPELQPRIFERFFRADKARSRSDSDGGGAGLGLSIALWIAQAHHGRLELTRSDSSGSTFTAFLRHPIADGAIQKPRPY
jgi:two-component system, OmpR family, sensor kinase